MKVIFGKAQDLITRRAFSDVFAMAKTQEFIGLIDSAGRRELSVYVDQANPNRLIEARTSEAVVKDLAYFFGSTIAQDIIRKSLAIAADPKNPPQYSLSIGDEKKDEEWIVASRQADDEYYKSLTYANRADHINLCIDYRLSGLRRAEHRHKPKTSRHHIASVLNELYGQLEWGSVAFDCPTDHLPRPALHRGIKLLLSAFDRH